MSPTIIILALLATATFGAGIPNVLQARGNGNGSTPLTTTPLTNSQAVAAFSDPKLHPDLISTQQIGPPHNGTPMAVKPVPFASQVAQNDTGFSAKIPISIDISPLPGNQQPWPTNSTTIEPTRRSLSARGSSCEPGYYCSPDNRYIFEDDRYPWSAIGRIQTPISTCTGALVGPHHVLTAAHCIDCASLIHCVAPPTYGLTVMSEQGNGMLTGILVGSLLNRSTGLAMTPSHIMQNLCITGTGLRRATHNHKRESLLTML
jgi:hypothetical protein